MFFLLLLYGNKFTRELFFANFASFSKYLNEILANIMKISRNLIAPRSKLFSNKNCIFELLWYLSKIDSHEISCLSGFAKSSISQRYCFVFLRKSRENLNFLFDSHLCRIRNVVTLFEIMV